MAGGQRRTALVASRRDLLELREVPVVLCGPAAKVPVRLAGGENRVVAAGTGLTVPTRLALTPTSAAPGGTTAGPTAPGGTTAGTGAAAPGAGGAPTDAGTGATRTALRVDEWSATRRVLRLGNHPGERVLALRENANAGWVATAAGRTLTPFVVDGWQQGWLVPADVAGEVTLRFAPDRGYVLALGAGAVLLAGVTLLAVLPWRRTPVPVVGTRRRRGRFLAALVGGGALLLFGGPAAVGVAVAVVVVVLAGRALGRTCTRLHGCGTTGCAGPPCAGCRWRASRWPAGGRRPGAGTPPGCLSWPRSPPPPCSGSRWCCADAATDHPSAGRDVRPRSS